MRVRISPIDIQQHSFKNGFFGYDKTDVDRFLEALAEELERQIRKNQDLQEQLDRVNATLADMKDREEMLKQTLVTTQKVTEELKSTARREVDVMMAEAEVKAERMMHNAEERRLQLIEEIQEIKRQKVDFEVSLRGLLEKHIRLIDLNAVAIEQQDADARLLEEPLPFEKQPASKTVEPPKTPRPQAKQPAQKVASSQRPAAKPVQKPSPAQQPSPKAVSSARKSLDKPVEDAVYAEPSQKKTSTLKQQSRIPEPPELNFEIDSGDDEDSKDLLK